MGYDGKDGMTVQERGSPARPLQALLSGAVGLGLASRNALWATPVTASSASRMLL